MPAYKQEKNDTVLNVRCKSTTLATIMSYFTTHGAIFINKSRLVRLALEEYEQYLVKEKGAVKCTSLEKARNYLDSKGITSLNPDSKLGQTFLEEGEREANFLDKSQGQQEPELENWQKEAVARITADREALGKKK